jgi:hypothetical protein
MIQEGLLFKGNQLCIPKCSMRENLLKEKHCGGLAGHFGHDMMFAKLRWTDRSSEQKSGRLIEKLGDRTPQPVGQHITTGIILL